LKEAVQGMNSLNYFEASKVSAITKVNSIRQKLYNSHDLGDLTGNIEVGSFTDNQTIETVVPELQNALSNVQDFEQILQSEIKVSMSGLPNL
jgi:hypothetical protein